MAQFEFLSYLFRQNALFQNAFRNSSPGSKAAALSVMKKCLVVFIVLMFRAEMNSQVQYVKLQRELDGSSYVTTGNKLYFTTDGEYSTANLNYAVYNYKRTLYSGLPITSSVLNNGDNRYTLTITTLPAGYYVLELTNQKKEKLYLRFKK